MDEMILSGADDGWDEETYSPLATPPIDGVLGNTPTSSPQPPATTEFQRDLVRLGLIPNEETFMVMWRRFHQLSAIQQRTPEEEAEFVDLTDRLNELQKDWGEAIDRERAEQVSAVDALLESMIEPPDGTSTPNPVLSPIPPTPPGSSPDSSPGPIPDSPPSSPSPQPSPPRVQTTTTASTPQHRPVVISFTQQRRQLETTIQRVERELYDTSLPYARVQRLQQKLTETEERLAEMNNNRSSPAQRRRETVRRRGSEQNVTSATSRETLGRGDHRTTTTTRTTTTYSSTMKYTQKAYLTMSRPPTTAGPPMVGGGESGVDMNRLLKTMAMREEESKTPYTNQLIQMKEDLDRLMKDTNTPVSVKLNMIKDKLIGYRRLLKKSRTLRGTPAAGTLMAATPSTPDTAITPVRRRSRTPTRREVEAVEPRRLFDQNPTPLYPTPPTTVGEEEDRGVRTRMQKSLRDAKRTLEELKNTPGSSGQKNKRAKKKKKKNQKGRGWTDKGWVPQPGEPGFTWKNWKKGGSLPSQQKGRGWTTSMGWVPEPGEPDDYWKGKGDIFGTTSASYFSCITVYILNGQPVAFASRTLSPTEQRYAQIENECLAIVFGCTKFSQYITRRAKVTIESDHKPLQSIFKKSLLEAPCRLQRMMLRLQRFNLDVMYKPVPQMYIADHLSRASVPDIGTPETEFQVFALELESICPLTTVKISSERLAQLQKATEQDPVMQTLKTTILIGWPAQRDEVPVHVREFWNFRDEFTLHNGVLFKNQRLIIPKALRSEVTSRIHSSHLGIESCLRKARDLVFWPSMNSEIKEAITNCSICAEYQAKQQRQPMQSHQIPDRPWSCLSSDLFTLHNKEYVVLVDSYSDFVEVRHLKTTTSATLIEFYKEQFSRHGIPDVLMTDNGPQYTSREFTDFAREWEFKHLSSSPHHTTQGLMVNQSLPSR
ncbi:hypothetical protein QZH41_002381 [Actinostola sp. cb2023]|nr:hypothetical protein QZH41_002381 [Actinostola sp. cb2023]